MYKYWTFQTGHYTLLPGTHPQSITEAAYY